jgi:hypothetical protein
LWPSLSKRLYDVSELPKSPANKYYGSQQISYGMLCTVNFGRIKFSEEREMKARILFVALALSLVAGASTVATNANLGTWILDQEKSKIPAGATKNLTVVYATAGDKIKVTVDGVRNGEKAHNEWIGKFDGKDYPITGDPDSDTRSYKKIDAHTLDLTNKKDGKVTITGRVVISADGKRRTVTVNATDASGKKTTYTSYYDKSE